MADDVARLGIAFESTGAPQVARDTQDVKKNVDDLSKSYSDMAKAQSSAFADAGNKTRTMGGYTREYTDAVKQLGAGQLAALDAVAKTNAEVQRSGSIWSALSQAIFGASPAIGTATSKFVEHEVAGRAVSKMLGDVGHDVRAFNPLLQQMGVNLGSLGISFRELSRLGPIGLGLLGVGGIGALLAALEQAGDKTEILKKNLEALTGGSKAFDAIEKSAQQLGVSTDSAANSFKALFSAIKGSEFDRAIDAMGQLSEKGFRFQSGAAGQQMALMMGQATGLVEDMQKLAQMFQVTGDNAFMAQKKARDFFAEFRGAGPASTEAINTLSKNLETLFLNAGVRADAAEKAITGFTSAGKLTAKEFASWPETVQKAIASAFKIDDIVKFQRILEAVKGIDVSTVAGSISKLGEQSRIDPTIPQAWDALVGSINKFLAKSSEAGGGFHDLSSALNSFRASIDSFTSSGQAEAFGTAMSNIAAGARTALSALNAIGNWAPTGFLARWLAGQPLITQDMQNQLNSVGQALGKAANSADIANSVGEGISAPDESAGNFATGGVFTVAGSGGTDSKRLRANVTPGEVVAIIPQSNVDENLLASMQAAVGGNPSSADNSTIKVAAPASYKAANASKALADLLGSRTSSGGQNALGLTPDQVTAALAQIAAIKATVPGSNVPGTSTVSTPAALAATTAALAGTTVAAGIDKSNPVYAAALAAQQAQIPGQGSYVASITHGSGGGGGGGRGGGGGGGGGDLFGPYQGRDLGGPIADTYNTRNFVDAYNSRAFGGPSGTSRASSGGGGSGGPRGTSGGGGSGSGGASTGQGSGILKQLEQSRALAKAYGAGGGEGGLPKQDMAGFGTGKGLGALYSDMRLPGGDLRTEVKFGGRNYATDIHLYGGNYDFSAPSAPTPGREQYGPPREQYGPFREEYGPFREQYGPFLPGEQNGPFQEYGPFAPFQDQYQGAPSYSDNYDFSQYYPSESFGNDGGFSGSSNMFGDAYSGGDSGYDYYGGAFAKGGSFVVPGSGPTDSVNVRMKMTPGERAIIIPPGSDNYDAGGFAGGGVISTSIVNPTNTDTPEYKAYQAWLETQYPGFSNLTRFGVASASPSTPLAAPPRLPLPSIDLGGGPASVSRPKAVTEQPKVFNFFGVTDMNSFQLSRAALNRFARQ